MIKILFFKLFFKRIWFKKTHIFKKIKCLEEVFYEFMIIKNDQNGFNLNNDSMNSN
jgi:hypothetical protein